MTIEDIKSKLPEYAKDSKINLSQLLEDGGAVGLSDKQVYGAALAASLALNNMFLAGAVKDKAQNILSVEDVKAIKAAVSIMAMNNVYYRALHLMEDAEYQKMPAKLRMMILNSHGVNKVDFEVYALAVSVLNACGMCINAHARQLVKEGVSKEGVQSVLRMAAVIHACHVTLVIEERGGV